MYENKRQVWDTFANGVSNAAAVKAAKAFAEGKDGYSAVFLYGKTGCGKTHLSYALKYRLEDQGNRVWIGEADLLMSKLIAHLSGGGDTEGFYKTFEETDVLILEDIQNFRSFPAGEKYCKELIKRCIKAKKKVWLTADGRSAIVRWLGCGLFRTVKIWHPDRDLKREIIIKCARDREFTLPDEVIDLLVESKGNMRTILGQLKRGMFYQRILGNELNRKLLERLAEEDRMKERKKNERDSLF